MTSEIAGLREMIDKIENRSSGESLSRPARLKRIKEQLGFYPHSNDEVTSAISLSSREGQAYPTLMYLDEVAAHQHRYKSPAASAIESIVRDFDDYAGNALDEIGYMKSFSTHMDDINPNALTSFSTLFPIENWENDRSMIVTFTAMARHYETEVFTETETNDKLGKLELIDNTTGEQRLSRIIDTLGVLRASSLQRIAQGVSRSEENRLEFWMGQLEASKRHAFARDIATIALIDLQKSL